LKEKNCKLSPTGVHIIKNGPPFDEESWKLWNKLSLKEKIESQFCTYCGEPIW